jgi:hypothetical protein
MVVLTANRHNKIADISFFNGYTPDGLGITQAQQLSMAMVVQKTAVVNG